MGEFVQGVREEMRRTTFPSSDEVRKTTIIVVINVIFFALYLFLVDRKKDMIISGGENIYSREVENAVLAHPAVQDCAAIGVADAKWGEGVRAFVVFKPGRSLGAEEIIAHCKTLIAGYKCPKQVEVIAELPRTGTGKVNKIALRERAQQSAG